MFEIFCNHYGKISTIFNEVNKCEIISIISNLNVCPNYFSETSYNILHSIILFYIIIIYNYFSFKTALPNAVRKRLSRIFI